jgi:DNA helicase-4
MSLETLNLTKPPILARLTGQAWLLESDSDTLFVSTPEVGRVPVHLQRSDTTIHASVTGYALTFHHNGERITVSGLPKKPAETLQAAIREARNQRKRRELAVISERLEAAWAALPGHNALNSDRYVQRQDTREAVDVAELHSDDIDQAVQLSEEIGNRGIVPRAVNRLLRVRDDSEGFHARQNERRLHKHFSAAKELFEKAGLNLTREQGLAALSMEKSNLLEAGAGSGKTVVIVARCLYAVSEGIALPSEILCLAYNKEAAVEIKQRVVEVFAKTDLKGADQIKVATFHGFGAAIVQRAHNYTLSIDDGSSNESSDLFTDALNSVCRVSDHQRTLNRLKKLVPDDDSAARHEKLIANLREAESAWFLSKGRKTHIEIDESIAETPEFVGLSSETATAAKGYAGFVAALSSMYRQSMSQSNLLDFSSMTVRANELLKQAKELPKDQRSTPELDRRFILVDEFQDISFDRASLVRSLAHLHDNSVVFGVGDDWQAINRFAGSDISLFTGFEEFFGDTDRRQLTSTFRSCRGIAEVARQFIIANPRQSRKAINNVLDERIRDCIVVLEYRRNDQVEEQIRQVINQWIETDKGGVPTVMVIGRYRLGNKGALTKTLLNRLQKRFEGLATITYNTAHGSKGLEADYVIIGTLSDGAFPSRRKKELWQEALRPPEEKDIDVADERRLFYVALTRAKKAVALLSPGRKASPFIAEVVAIYRSLVRGYNG